MMLFLCCWVGFEGFGHNMLGAFLPVHTHYYTHPASVIEHWMMMMMDHAIVALFYPFPYP
jgi:hypothetical protein